MHEHLAVGVGRCFPGEYLREVCDLEALATLEAAVSQGFKWFDVAPLSGYGLVEERLGQFLRQSDMPRPSIATKVGWPLRPRGSQQNHRHFIAPLQYRSAFDYNAGGIERSYEESLQPWC